VQVLSKSHVPRHAKKFTDAQLFGFWAEAPNEGEMLRLKALSLCGFYGGCRTSELVPITWSDVEIDGKNGVWITIKRAKTPADKAIQRFLIPNEKHCSGHRVVPSDIFLQYRTAIFAAGRLVPRIWRRFWHGRFTQQCLGKETIKEAPKTLALFLGLDPEGYRGHSWRPSSATALSKNGGSPAQLKTLGGWASLAVADQYNQESEAQRINIATVLSKDGSQEDPASPAPHPAPQQPEEGTIPPPKKVPCIIFNGPVSNCVFTFPGTQL